MASKKQAKTVTVGFVALGCPKNIVDGESCHTTPMAIQRKVCS